MCYSCQEEEGNKKGKGKWKKLKYAKTGIIEHKMQTVFSALMWFKRGQGWRSSASRRKLQDTTEVAEVDALLPSK